MDIKAKYQYTYFLNPFVVHEHMYENFLYKLIKDEKWNFRMFDKVVDMEIYTHFLPQAKEILFSSFFWSDEYKRKIKNLENEKLAKELAKQNCVEFVFDINDFFKVQGKIEQENQIFFEIIEMKLICFNTGICFFVFKTNITDSDYVSFRDVLNFNHKFKDIASRYSNYKGKDNVYIQTSQLDSLAHLSTFVNDLINGYAKSYNEDIYSDRMFVYSYACIDEANWNSNTGFEQIKDNFYKYVFQFSGDYDSEIDLSQDEIDNVTYSRWKYSKYGFTKLGGVLFCSATDHFNFTSLPSHYENISFYIMLLAFYKRIALLELSNELMTNSKIDSKSISWKINELLYKTRVNQITNSEHGMNLWKNWLKAFELEELYSHINEQYAKYISDEKYKSRILANIITAIVAIVLIISCVALLYSNAKYLIDTNSNHMGIEIIRSK